MAPFTLFSFQRRIRKSYQLLPQKKLPRPFRILNRIVLALLLTWGILHLGRIALSHTGKNPVAPVATGDTLKAVNQASTDDSTLYAADSTDTQAEEEFDSTDTDTNPVVEVPDTAPAVIAHTKVDDFEPKYQKDSLLGLRVDKILRQYRPYAAFYLMVDSRTNEIIAWGQRSDSAVQPEPTYLSRATFPSASLYKIVTSVAALETSRFATNSTVPLIGRSTTLYSRQLKLSDNYKGPYITLEDAFARSCNPAMGIIGQHIGGRTLRKFATRLGFNRPFPGGAPQPSRSVPPDSGFGLAEVASGFTRENRVSPLHMAAIVRALVTEQSVQIPWSHSIPSQFAPREPITLDESEFHPDTYYGIRQLMLRTVTNGTARKHMRRTLTAVNRDALFIGGKTGSLDGDSPKGRYDWFAGFAQSRKDPKLGVVLVVMQVHNRIRTLPSSGIAGLLINAWAKEALKQPETKKKKKH